MHITEEMQNRIACFEAFRREGSDFFIQKNNSAVLMKTSSHTI